MARLGAAGVIVASALADLVERVDRSGRRRAHLPARDEASLARSAGCSVPGHADPCAKAGIQLELHLESFDGPLELLLLLIEQRRLPITQVSLAQVADQYLAQVHAQPALDTELLADFLVIGGKLLLLKSRALLLTEEPDPEVEEVASDLAERLATYRVFRAAAEVLRELEQRGERMYPTLREPLVSTAPAPLAPLGPDALAGRLATLPGGGVAEPDRAGRRSARQRRRAARAHPGRAASRRRTCRFARSPATRVDQVIATFLAVLELFRRGQIAVEQPALFGDLILSLGRRRSELLRILEQLARRGRQVHAAWVGRANVFGGHAVERAAAVEAERPARQHDVLRRRPAARAARGSGRRPTAALRP